MSSQSLKRDLALVEQLDDCWPTDSKQVGGLLCRQLQRPRSHRHCEPLLKRLNYLAKHAVDLGWKLDAVAGGSSSQEVPWLHRPSARRLMRLHKVVDLGNLPISFWQVRLFLQSNCSHGTPVSKAS